MFSSKLIRLKFAAVSLAIVSLGLYSSFTGPKTIVAFHHCLKDLELCKDRPLNFVIERVLDTKGSCVYMRSGKVVAPLYFSSGVPQEIKPGVYISARGNLKTEGSLCETGGQDPYWIEVDDSYVHKLRGVKNIVSFFAVFASAAYFLLYYRVTPRGITRKKTER